MLLWRKSISIFSVFQFNLKLAYFKGNHTLNSIVKIGLKNAPFYSVKFVLDLLIKIWSQG